MSEDIRRAKKLLRRVLRDRRRTSDPSFSLPILDIEKWPQKWQDKVKAAGCIALYMPIDEELLLDPLMEKLPQGSVKMCFPRVEGEEISFCEAETTDSFEKGSFSIPEPGENLKKVDPAQIDIMLVPGMAYDSCGIRLGRGKGYYDRFCGKMDKKLRPLFIGVTANKNIFSAFPADTWDLKVDALVTETVFCSFLKE